MVVVLLVLFQRLQLPAASPRRSYEGFCEDLAHQNTVARRFQRQLGFGVATNGFQSSS
jgi:hypothetical protein